MPGRVPTDRHAFAWRLTTFRVIMNNMTVLAAAFAVGVLQAFR